MSRIILMTSILASSIFCLSQERTKQIGINLVSDFNWYDEWRIGPSISFTNQLHFFSLEAKIYRPEYSDISFDRFALNYRIYPNSQLNTFNLFYSAGLDFKYKRTRFTRNDFSYHSWDTETYTVHVDNKDFISAFSLGFGFQINVFKNFNFTTSVSGLIYYYSTNNEMAVQVTPVDVIEYNNQHIGYSPLLLIGAGYNIDLKQTKSSSKE